MARHSGAVLAPISALRPFAEERSFSCVKNCRQPPQVCLFEVTLLIVITESLVPVQLACPCKCQHAGMQDKTLCRAQA